MVPAATLETVAVTLAVGFLLGALWGRGTARIDAAYWKEKCRLEHEARRAGISVARYAGLASGRDDLTPPEDIPRAEPSSRRLLERDFVGAGRGASHPAPPRPR